MTASRPTAIVPGHGAVGTVHDVVELAGYLDALLEASRRDPTVDESDGLPLAVDGWWDPWHDRIPHATHRMNLERARRPADIPQTLLQLIQEG